MATSMITMETALQPCCMRCLTDTLDVYRRSVSQRKGSYASIWRAASASSVSGQLVRREEEKRGGVGERRTELRSVGRILLPNLHI